MLKTIFSQQFQTYFWLRDYNNFISQATCNQASGMLLLAIILILSRKGFSFLKPQSLNSFSVLKIFETDFHKIHKNFTQKKRSPFVTLPWRTSWVQVRACPPWSGCSRSSWTSCRGRTPGWSPWSSWPAGCGCKWFPVPSSSWTLFRCCRRSFSLQGLWAQFL